MRWTRRRFVGTSVAAVCVGCSSDENGSSSPSVSLGDVPAAAAATSTTPVESPIPAFRQPVAVGTSGEVRAATAAAPLYVPAARAWLVALSDEKANLVAAEADELLRPGLAHGLLALHEKCPHLGCRVPYCESSGWFECMCHGTQFNVAGEHRAGPGPRGLDAMPVVVEDGVVSIAIADVLRGAPVGTVVLDQAATGPHCVGDVDH